MFITLFIVDTTAEELLVSLDQFYIEEKQELVERLHSDHRVRVVQSLYCKLFCQHIAGQAEGQFDLALLATGLVGHEQEYKSERCVRPNVIAYTVALRFKSLPV